MFKKLLNDYLLGSIYFSFLVLLSSLGFLFYKLKGIFAGTSKWRPKLHYIREDLFVFEDVSRLGYKMPHFKETMTIDALKATVKTLARFHAQSYIYEETRSKELGKPYRIWDEFSEYLQEPAFGKIWRDTGRNAVIEYLKQFSKHKARPDFIEKINEIMPMLYEKAIDLMKPSNKYRNAVVHRDLWSNNIFIKGDGTSELHALIVDFQTVIYTSPMLDLSSLIYFNTLKACRDSYGNKLIELYYNTLSDILEEANVNIETVLSKDDLMEAYNYSLLFGMTQASIIVPIISMSSKRKEEIFCDPIKSQKANLVSRSEEFIEIANEDSVYKNRLSELLDEIVEKYVYPSN